MSRIGIFVDVQNIYYTVKQKYSAHFDYQQFLKKIGQEGKIVLANAYATDKNDKAQKRFQSLLSSFGYQVKLIDYIERKDGTSKGDWDIGIALDIMENHSSLDKIILASGDGDYEHLIHNVKVKSRVKFDVFGVYGLTSKKLIEAADQYTPIDNSLLLTIPDKW